jgi:hypothetical protein
VLSHQSVDCKGAGSDWDWRVVVPLQAVVTLPDLEGWKESAAAVTLKILGSLHTRLQASMATLQQQLAGELGARQQAAEAKQQVGSACLAELGASCSDFAC